MGNRDYSITERLQQSENGAARQDPPAADTLRVIPLGGCGEFGKNMTVLECGGDMIVVDCGQMFPEPEMLGVDSVIPDFSYVLDNAERLRGLVLTHGHEDHIGATPYLARCFEDEPLPVYGARLTLALMREKLREGGVSKFASLNAVHAGDAIELGCFTVNFLNVAHSFPESFSLAIQSPAGGIVVTGDFKFDDSFGQPPSGLETLPDLMPEGALLLLADSTNAERAGHSPSEESVFIGLREIFESTSKAIMLSCFSSALVRVQTALDMADAFGRKVALCGFSLERNFALATELGMLRYRQDIIRPIREVAELPPHERLIMLSGTQGEPDSALSRLARNSLRGYRAGPDDLVILSSRMIPGNERAIHRVIDQFYRHGARVVTEREAAVHASGHACREELARVLELASPKYFAPIHGNIRQQVSHRDLAVERGLPSRRIFVMNIGEQLEIEPGGALHLDTDWSGHMLVDGNKWDSLDEIVLRDRKHLSEDGMVTAIFVVEDETHRIAAGPDIVTRGFVVVDESEDLIKELKRIAREAYESGDIEDQEDMELVKVRVRKALRKFIGKKTARYPVILPVIVEV